ncbi:MAG: hypothetical protein RSG75_03310 [Cellulosilyticaceae bacterium]
MYALVSCKGTKIPNRQEHVDKVFKWIKEDIAMMEIGDNQSRGLGVELETSYIEKEFMIKLKGQFVAPEMLLDEKKLVAYVGHSDMKENEKNYYNLDTNQFMDKNNGYVIGFSDSNEITSTKYLKFILDMICKSLEENKKLIIYADVYIEDENLRYRSVLNKLINKLLDEVNGVLINKLYGNMALYYRASSNGFEFYIEDTIYTEDEIDVALSKIRNISDGKYDRSMLKRLYREVKATRVNGLYHDIFYEQIPDEEHIYVPILQTSIVPREVYEGLGFQYIRIDRNYALLWGTKKLFDSKKEDLANNVIPQYALQIQTHPPVIKADVPGNYELDLRVKQEYNGEEVYIGIIGVAGVDYKENNLIDSNGKSRIAYVWEQKEGDKGRVYLQEEIQNAVKNNVDLDIGIGGNSYLTNTLLAIAGGNMEFKQKEYKGVASQASFIIAKINKAPDTLQRIYGGLPNEEATLLEDILIAVNQLVDFANEQKKPLVLCIPYGGNLNSHDGKSVLETRIETFANQPGITILTSTGEEADKGHHSRITIEDNQEYTVELRIQEALQKVVGTMWIDDIHELSVVLENPMKQQYNLEEKGKYVENTTEVLTTGIAISFDNGLREILFSLENPMVGVWKIIIKEKVPRNKESYADVIDIWIAQQALNSYSGLSPDSVFVTIPSIGNVPNIISIGNYDNETLTIYKSSGRGYTRQDLVKPTFVAQGKNVLAIIALGKMGLLTGSLVSMANVAGVVAALYSKMLVEQESPWPNSLVISSILISQLTRVDTIQYPNPSQGNGILDRAALQRLIKSKK